MSSDQDQSMSDLSHTSAGDNQTNKKHDREDSTDSESSENMMAEQPDEFSSLEGQPSSLAANDTGASPADTQVIQDEKPASAVGPSTEGQSEEATSGPQSKEPKEGESDAEKPAQDQMLKAAPGDTPGQPSVSKNKTSQPGPGEGTQPTNPKDQKTAMKNSKNKKETVNTEQAMLDQNADEDSTAKQTVEPKQKGKKHQDQKQQGKGQQEQKQKGKDQQEQKQKQSEAQSKVLQGDLHFTHFI